MSSNNKMGSAPAATTNVEIEQVPVPNSGKWSSGLYDCFDDPSNCCTTCFFPYVTFGRNVDIIDKGKTSPLEAGRTFYLLGIWGFSFCYSAPFRTQLRNEYSLPEEPCGDCCVHCCCVHCALCQEYRELKYRGLDPSKGWAAHAAKMNQNGRQAPAVEQGMSRQA